MVQLNKLHPSAACKYVDPFIYLSTSSARGNALTGREKNNIHLYIYYKGQRGSWLMLIYKSSDQPNHKPIITDTFWKKLYSKNNRLTIPLPFDTISLCPVFGVLLK